MPAWAVDRRIKSAQRKLSQAEVALRSRRTKAKTSAKNGVAASSSDSSIRRIAKGVELLAKACGTEPDQMKELWRVFCIAAVAGQLGDYQREGTDLQKRFDEVIRLCHRVAKLATELNKLGASVPSAAAVLAASERLVEMKRWFFQNWPLTIEGLKAELHNLDLEVKAAAFPLKNDKLVRLAARRPPSQSWYDDDGM